MANGANVIRDLFVRLGVQVSPKARNDTARFERGIEAAKKTLEDTADLAVRAGTALVGVMSAAVGGLGALAIASGRTAIEIERQARALQLTRQEYQALLATFERFGADETDVADALGTITDKAQELVDGTQAVVDDFKLIGIGIDDVRGRRPIELFEMFADRVAGAADRNKALTAVVRILGDDLGRKINPALLEGSAGLRAMAEEARALGLVLTDEQLAAQRAVADEWRVFTSVVRGVRNELGAELAPTVAGLLKSWNEWIRANREFVGEKIEDGFRFVRAAILAANQAAQLVGGWDVVFLNVATGAGILLLLANLGKVQAFLSGLRTAITVVGTAFGIVGGAIGVSSGVVAAAILALLSAVILLGLAVQDFWVFWQGGESLLGRNLDRLQEMIPALASVRRLLSAVARGAETTWLNMTRFATAIARGFLPALRLLEKPLMLFEATLSGIAAAWAKINENIGGNIDSFTNLLNGAIGGGDVNGAAVAAGIESSISGAVGSLVDRILGSGGGGSSSISSAVVNQTNNFASAGTEALERFDSALRSGNLSIAGGPR